MRSLIQPHDRLGMSGPEAAEYIGVSQGTFHTMVEDKRMPSPKVIGARRVWDRRTIEKAFAQLPTDGVEDAEWVVT